MNNTSIEWTDKTWNPLTGCTKVSQGCKHCYAETIHERFNGKGSFRKVTCHEDRLQQPLKWKKPAKVFVNSMSDLFHEDVPLDFIKKVFAVMNAAKQHTFQVLTKRSKRLLEVSRELEWGPNIWMGVSVENQDAAEERILDLMHSGAAVTFLSCEPLLGPVNLDRIKGPIDPEEPEEQYFFSAFIGNCWEWEYEEDWFDSVDGPTFKAIDWVIVGGESGHGARPMHPDWVRSLRDQCSEAEVPFFFKQWGAWQPMEKPQESQSIKSLSRNEQWLNLNGGQGFHGEEVYRMKRVGKKWSGRLLNGQFHDQFPLTETIIKH